MRPRAVLILLLSVALFWPCSRASSEEQLGVVDRRPESGHFVEYRGQFLIPYKQPIPGSDAQIKMTPVPAGKYRLQFLDDAGEPQSYSIYVEPFWIASTEITWKQYRAFMELDKAFRQFEQFEMRPVLDEPEIDVVSAPSEIYDSDFRMHSEGGTDQHPAATMTQFGAKAYTKYLSRLTGVNYRLPSAVEWRYAAHGPQGQPDEPYSADDLKEVAWFAGNAQTRQLVGQKKANAWGIHDMLGNVSEWVLDGEGYREQAFADKMKISSIDAVAWPTTFRQRWALGGSYQSPLQECQYDSLVFSNDEFFEEDPMIPQSPHWTCSFVGQGVGFRIVRPWNNEFDKEMAKRYWEPDHPDMEETIGAYIEMGHVRKGLVDANLFKDLGEIGKRRRK